MGVKFRITRIYLEDQPGNLTEEEEEEGFGNWTMDSPPDLRSADTEALLIIFQIFLLVLIFVTGAVLNGLVTYILLRKHRFASSTGNLFLLSLTGSNLVVCMVCIPLLLLTGSGVEWREEGWVCLLTGTLHLLVIVASNFTLAFIAIDRYYAIVRPLSYHEEFTVTKGAFTLGLGWILACFVSFPPLFGWSSIHMDPVLPLCVLHWARHPVFSILLLSLSFLVPFLIISFSYFYIYSAADFQKQSLCSRVVMNGKLTSSVSSPLLQRPLPTKAELRATHKLNWLVFTYPSPGKALRTVGLLLLSFLIPWSLVLSWAVLSLTSSSTPPPLTFIAFFALCLTHPLYPILYGFFNKGIRKRIFRALGRRVKQKQAISLSGTQNPSFLDYLPARFRRGSKRPSGVDPYDLLEATQARRRWQSECHEMPRRSSKHQLSRKNRDTTPKMKRRAGAPRSALMPRGNSVPANIAQLNTFEERFNRSFCRIAVGTNYAAIRSRDQSADRLDERNASQVLSAIQRRLDSGMENGRTQICHESQSSLNLMMSVESD